VHSLDCHERALRLLSARMRSRRELRDRLARAGFDAAEIAAELDRLEAVGLVDDARFAREFSAAAVSSRGLGRRALTSALRGKGVDADVVETAVAEVAGDDQDEEARALDLARSRARRLRGTDPARSFARLSAALGRRGYPPDLARRAARRALEIDAVECGGIEA
jgi:regulatory protein